MTWPTPQDYNEAIQNPLSCFMDPRLKQCTPYATVLGLPRAITGAFATVYRLSSPDKHWAVRCFLQNSPDLPKRYSELSSFVCSDDLPYTVDVHYQPQGIKIKGEWYPILLMEWVDGPTLDQYIFENLDNPAKLTALADKFSQMMSDMRRAGIAHGDLQHGNIIIVDDDIRLVDYDGMFVPALHGFESNELGHMNYQHPARTSQHFSPQLDNFSAWSILTSIRCLSHDNRLWEWLSAGDECLLFRKADYANPLGSRSFATLESHTNQNIQRAARIMRAILSYSIMDVPALNADLQEVADLPAVQSSPLSAPINRSSKALPEWMHDGPSFYKDSNKPAPRGAWPRYEQYQKAALSGATSFDDPELQVSKCLLEHVHCGRNGIVFRFAGFQRQFAVKCFFNEVPDRQKRYEAIARAITNNALERYFQPFEYLPAGIKVGSFWYPILKMEWSYGMPLEKALKLNIGENQATINLIAYNFGVMLERLHAAGIAHGDLEPENLLMEAFDFKLVDYDGMYVPELAGMLASETGTNKYQHHLRTRKHFGPYLDNYSAWIIDTYIRVANYDPSLWQLINRRLRNDPTGDSDEDWTFRFMNLNSHRPVRARVKELRQLLELDVEQIPRLTETQAVHSDWKSAFNKGLRYFLLGKTDSPELGTEKPPEFSDDTR